LKALILRLVGFICPPIKLWKANSYIKKKYKIKNQLPSDEKYESTFSVWIKVISGKTNESLIREADKFEQNELHRKEILENKASSLITALGLSLTLILIISAVIGKDWGLPKHIALLSASALVLAIIHLLVAAFYAIKTSQLTAFYFDCTETIKNKLEKGNTSQAEILAEKLTNIDMNTPALIIKSNYLSLAQNLFLRGIFFISIGSLVALGYQIIY